LPLSLAHDRGHILARHAGAEPRHNLAPQKRVDPVGLDLEPADYLDVYAYKIDVTGRTNVKIVNYRGLWNVGDTIRFSVDVPSDYFDEANGWELRYCVGNAPYKFRPM
jgi:hypothetical protein